jgi:hypothetical protein
VEGARSRPTHERRSLVLDPAVSVVPFGFEGDHDHPRALASRGLPPLLAMEIQLAGRPAANQRRPPAADPADEHGQSAMGAPRIHGELLKLGFEVAQSSVAKYMVKRCGPPSQE